MGERVSGAGRTEEFATLLRELKDRSGLSYGVLAKRLHTSASTLHRYCNGIAVPGDYAPVERLARVCRATPQELVELHRRWILADAARGLRGDSAAATGAGEAGSGDDATAEPAATKDSPQEAGPTESARAAGAPRTVDTGSAADAVHTQASRGRGEDGAADEPVVVRVARGLAPPRRRRTALVASAAVAAVLVAAVLVAHPPWVGDGNDAKNPQAVGTTASDGTADASQGSARPGAAAGPTGGSAVPFAVGVRPYVYDDPCSQHFLVDSAPERVGPPANEQNAPRWAAVYGAVSSGEQRVALTVQGTGADTVVLEALHVNVEAKAAPLAWNDYAMGVGCGGGVGTKTFAVDLDKGSPTVTLKNGQRDFPYKVSESDPEVFYVTAHTKAHDVRWNLTLDWSSGSRRGTVRIDNNGTPFRTSADVGRPGYDYPLGGSDWITRMGG